jgi:HAD superfamily hydrolase (TIGR01459 family)
MLGDPTAIPIGASISAIAGPRKAWLVDLWGVMHNGVAANAAAVDACVTFRRQGGTVVFLSNAPRPWTSVAQQLERLGVARGSWDHIITSGDVTRQILQNAHYETVYHLGPDRDLGLYEGLEVARTLSSEADLIVCTGLFDDERETADAYRHALAGLARRQVPMLCANPDLAVIRGERLIPCAGAVAQVFEALGGAVTYAGKPYRGIYDRAIAAVAVTRGAHVDTHELLAIGDGILTDIRGATSAGIPAVYIASGVHLPDGVGLDATSLATLFPDPESRPIAAMPALAW